MDVFEDWSVEGRDGFVYFWNICSHSVSIRVVVVSKSQEFHSEYKLFIIN